MELLGRHRRRAADGRDPDHARPRARRDASATTIHVMYAGRIVESGAADAAASQRPVHPYTRGAARLDLPARPRRRPADRRDRRAAAAPAAAPVRLPLPPALPVCARTSARPRRRRRRAVRRPQASSATSRRAGQRERDRLRRGVDAARDRSSSSSDLRRHFRLGGRRAAAGRPGGRRRLARDRPRRDVRARRRVGLGQVDARAAPAPARPADRRAASLFDGDGPLRGSRRRELRRLRREMQIVFQDPFASLNRRQTVEQIVSFPLRVHEPRRSARQSARGARVASCSSSSACGPTHAARLPAPALRRPVPARVSIARALALEPELVVLDEAVSAVDVSIQAQILNLLRELQERLALTYLFVTPRPRGRALHGRHDRGHVPRPDRRAGAARARSSPSPRHPYTHALLASIPPRARRERSGRRRSCSREAAASDTLPSGCRFHPRCPLGDARALPDGRPAARSAVGRGSHRRLPLPAVGGEPARGGAREPA